MSDLDYDPYQLQRADERKAARAERLKEKLRKNAGKGPSRDKQQREPVTSLAKVESDRSRKNSRVKGSRAELDIAQMFSRWCGEVVRRTPGSGGWSNDKFGVTGDLVCSKRKFPFHVEIKHREGWTLDDLVTGVRRDHDKSILQWWVQCLESCPRNDSGTGIIGDMIKEPLLVFRRNRQPWLVMVRASWVGVDTLYTSIPQVVTVMREDGHDDTTVVVMLLSEFLRDQPVPKGLKNHRKEKR